MDFSARARYQQLQQDDEQHTDPPTGTRGRASELMQQLPSRSRMGAFVLVALCSALATVAAVALFAAVPTKCLLSSPTAPKKTYPPNFPFTSTVAFQHDSRYTGPGWEGAYDRIGLNTPPYPGGFVAVPHPRRYGLHGGVSLLPLNGTIPQEKYCLSVFHQIHCLKMLRVSMQALRAGAPRQHAGGFTEHEDHCFEYIRQALMCSADVTLEEPRPGEDGDTDGWGTEHVCRRWEDVEGWAREHAYTKWWDRGRGHGAPEE